MNPQKNITKASRQRACHQVPAGVRIGGLYAGCLLLMGGALAAIGAIAWWLAGIVGAFFVVPLIATGNAMVLAALRHSQLNRTAGTQT